MAERKKLVHIHSNVADKQPTPSALSEGELAVNYASGNEFISLKNTDNKVVRVSSDPVIMEWVEKKEVFPTGATVSSNTSNASTMTFQLNQKPGELSPSSAVGTSFVVDTSKYASTGADVTFRALTANSGLSVNGGNTTIKGGDITLSASNSTTVSGLKTVISGGTLGVDLIGGTRGVVVQDNNGIAFEVRGQSNLSGNTNVVGNLTVQKNVTANGSLTVNSGASISGTDVNIDAHDVTIYATNGTLIKTQGGGNATALDVRGNTEVAGNLSASSINSYGDFTVEDADFVSIKALNQVDIQAQMLNVTGDTTIDGTLDVKSGLTKSASWSYGSVSGGTNGSYNGSANKSFTIPKSIEHLSNYSAGTVTLDDDIVIKKDLYVSGSIITTGSSAQQNLNLNYGDVRNASSATYNGTAEKTVAIPKSIDHLTNYDGTAITMPHSVKVSGAVTADGGLVVKNGATISGDVTIADADDVSIKATNEVSFRTQIVSTNGTINVENGANISGSTKISGNTTISGQLNVTNGLVVTGASTISGNTTIGGTLAVPSGLTKSVSWSYGSVSAATNGSYNGSADKTVSVPKSIDHLTNYDGTSINLPHNVKVSGTISANSAIYSSDVSLKENIKPIGNDDIVKVKSVQFKSFNFKDDEEKRKTYGVIAQEIEAVKLNELVHVADDGKKGVDYISLLILKMAALEAEVKALRNEVLHLNSKIEELKK